MATQTTSFVSEPTTERGIAAELRALSKRLSEMSGLAEAQLVAAIEALEHKDVDAASQIIARDAEIDEIETEVNGQAMALLTRHAPVAADLREIVAALKISSNVERIGDYVANVAKRTIVISGFSNVPAVTGVIEMGRMVRMYVQNVFDAYSERDLAKAEAVWRGDADIDALHTSVFQELLSDMLSDPDHVPTCTHLMFCIKSLERIGDHATNIAETIQFLVAGKALAERRPKQGGTAGLDPTLIKTHLSH
jgi:phosphate transport system protein